MAKCDLGPYPEGNCCECGREMVLTHVQEWLDSDLTDEDNTLLELAGFGPYSLDISTVDPVFWKMFMDTLKRFAEIKANRPES